MLHTHAAICCVKCAGGIWWSNCVRLKSDILFECYFSERELKIDEIWHLHKPTKKKVISKTNFPGVQLSLTNSQPVITSQWNYSLIGGEKTKQQNKNLYCYTIYSLKQDIYEVMRIKGRRWRKMLAGTGTPVTTVTLPSAKCCCIFEVSWSHRLNLHNEKRLYSFNTGSPNSHLITIKLYSFCSFNLFLARKVELHSTAIVHFNREYYYIMHT